MGEKPFYLSARIKLLRCEGVFQKGLLHSEKARKIPPLQNEGPFFVKIPAGVHKSAIEKSISILYNTSLNLNRIGRFC